MKSATIAFFATLAATLMPDAAIAHPGHGATDPGTVVHLLEMPHALWIVVAVATGLWLARRRRRRG